MNEHELQAAVIQWRNMVRDRHPALPWLHAIPNGAALPHVRSKGGRVWSPQAVKLIAEGMTAGIPDLFLPWAEQGFHGFYIECKRPGNLSGVRDGQKAFAAYAERAGYLCQVLDDPQDVIDAITWYLGL